MPRRQHPTADDPHAGVVRRSLLPGGLRVVSEHLPAARSVAVGIFVGTGSRYESPRQAGASHYLEHLLFKGTARRTAQEISASLERVGGELNAYTTKDHTCYHARALAADLPLTVDVLADMVLSSLLNSADVEAERGVILEEIAMEADDPADVAHEQFARALFGDAPLGRPVLGSVASIEAMSRATIARYWRRTYTPDRVVIAAAGQLDHNRLLRLVRRAFGGWLADAAPVSGTPAPGLSGSPLGRPAQPVRMLRRRTEQANLVLGARALARGDDRRMVLAVLNAALGGGMSSRLFQEIREKRGLAYSVYSFTAAYADDGALGIYVGCQPRRVRDVLAICREQLADVATRGLTDAEVALGRGQVRGSLLLSHEDTETRMTRWGRGELLRGELVPVAEDLARIDAVSPDDVRTLAGALLGAPLAVTGVGAFPKADLEELVA
ncbi:MAG TPA: pitrilysin family protein [Mycobacteriales bacterium]|jgi:predicted Zn-dependent peptidase|nr:pitrilysin family protein [Mycobacteriales bacterium]